MKWLLTHDIYFGHWVPYINTSLAAPGALAHRLQGLLGHLPVPKSKSQKSFLYCNMGTLIKPSLRGRLGGSSGHLQNEEDFKNEDDLINEDNVRKEDSI